jgi:hypothetical protein|tara:strand:+ start:447 stop:704 length:258 start_codon:yes stop_codon:yes gene_type:complete
MAKESTKFTEDEMKKIKEFKGLYDTMTIRMGQVSVERMVLDKTENDIKTKWNETLDSEREFVDSLSKKYGQGSIDLDTGVFMPAN